MKTNTYNFDPAKADDMPPGRHTLGHLGVMLDVDGRTGRRAWVQKLSISGKQRWISLGRADEVKFRHVIAPAEQHRASARRGEDPVAARRAAAQEAAQAARTVSDVLRSMREKKEPGLAARTVTSTRLRHRIIEDDDLGKVPIASLTGEQVGPSCRSGAAPHRRRPRSCNGRLPPCGRSLVRWAGSTASRRILRCGVVALSTSWSRPRR